jgi:hypothetical protein
MHRILSRRATATLAGAVAGLIFGLAPVHAQQTQRLRGEITRVDGDKLTLRAPNGQPVTVLLASDATVSSVVPAKLSDIKPGRLVGTAARPEPNNRWQALEVHVFPVGVRLGEGHRPWEPEPGATMTNSDVTAAVVHAGKAELTLTTGGKDYIIDVPPGTPIVAENPGTRALVKKGAMVAISRALPGAGGAFTAKSITVTTVKNYPPK